MLLKALSRPGTVHCREAQLSTGLGCVRSVSVSSDDSVLLVCAVVLRDTHSKSFDTWL